MAIDRTCAESDVMKNRSIAGRRSFVYWVGGYYLTNVAMATVDRVVRLTVIRSVYIWLPTYVYMVA